MAKDTAAVRTAVRAEYARIARDFDRRWSKYTARSVGETLRRLQLAPGTRLLDVGCGTGTLLAAVREPGTAGASVGIDLAPEMLRVARAKVAADVRLAAADALQLPFDDARFDVVVSSSAFHYWLDPVAGLAELRRVLIPGGRLVITDWCDDYLACRACDWLLRAVRPTHRRIYGTAECAAFLRQAGYAEVRVERYKITWLWGLMTATAGRPAREIAHAGP